MEALMNEINFNESWPLFVYMLFEYILGTTDRITSNSFPEIWVRLIGRVFLMFLPKNYVMAKKKGLKR
jgi:hypothetical protein